MRDLMIPAKISDSIRGINKSITISDIMEIPWLLYPFVYIMSL